jgi:hypothetical protein
MDFFTLGAVEAGAGAVTVVGVPVVTGVVVPVFAVLPPVVVVVVALPLVPVEAVLPAVTVDPLSPVVTTLPTVPVRTMVPTTVLEVPEDVVLVEAPTSLELPLVDPQPANESAITTAVTVEVRTDRPTRGAISGRVMFK